VIEHRVLPAESVGQRLKRLRLDRGLSQRELASPGVSYAYISRIEAGTRQPSVKALRRLAAKLGVSPEYLETGSDLDAAEARELEARRRGAAALGQRAVDRRRRRVADDAVAEQRSERRQEVMTQDRADAARRRGAETPAEARGEQVA